MEGQINDSAFDSAISTIGWKPNRPGMNVSNVFDDLFCHQCTLYTKSLLSLKKETVLYLKKNVGTKIKWIICLFTHCSSKKTTKLGKSFEKKPKKTPQR